MISPSYASHTPENSIVLARRDLFDARFQLIANDYEQDSQIAGDFIPGTGTGASDALAFVEAPSDLVPGVYEGGLKTWECALDLAGYLCGHVYGSENESMNRIKGRKVLEVRLLPLPTKCRTNVDTCPVDRVRNSDPDDVCVPLAPRIP